MSQTLVPERPDAVARSGYLQLRSLLALACTAIIGLSIAVGVLTTSGRSSRSTSVQVSAADRANQSTDTGARLDHLGRRDAAYLSGLAETGARLDHRGIKALLNH
jgi:hypothetical protein